MAHQASKAKQHLAGCSPSLAWDGGRPPAFGYKDVSGLRLPHPSSGSLMGLADRDRLHVSHRLAKGK